MKRTIVFDQRFYEALRRLELIARQPSGGRLEGARVSRRAGAGIEFAEWRPYAPGDSPRDVDWKALARLGSLFVRVRAREEASEVRVLVDASASMRFGAPSKFTFARRLAGALGAIGLAGMDAVTAGFLRAGRCELGTRVTGSEALSQIMHLLEEGTTGGATDLGAGLSAFLEQAAGAGLLIVLSDFWGIGDLGGSLRRAAERGFEGALLQVLSAQEIEPARTGRSRLVDAESAEELELTVSAAAVRAYGEELGGYVEHLTRTAEASGFRYALLRPEGGLEAAVLGELRRARIVG